MGELRRMNFAAADQPTTLNALSAVQRCRGILDAIEIEAARRLQELTHHAPAELATATQQTRHTADRVYQRAATLAAVPSLTEPLHSGHFQGAHIDTVTKILRTINDKHAAEFAAALPELVASAASLNATPDDLARTLNHAARTLENDDGTSRHHQQRRDTALHTWTDKRTGMFRLSARFDPLSGVLLHNRIQAMLAALFTERIPSTSPTDPSAKQDHLRALALLALTLQHTSLPLAPDPTQDGGAQTFSNDDGTNSASASGHASTTNPDTGHNATSTTNNTRGPDTPNTTNNTSGTETARNHSRADDDTAFDEWSSFFRTGPAKLGRPEIIVVVDARQTTLDTNAGKPVIDWGLPIELPARALQTLFAQADTHPIITANGIILHAPGEMNLGRTTRLASRAQRRALRALYPTCAIPGCRVAYEFTKPHHIHHWEHDGPTDLDNLLPLCSRHHHHAHEGGWKLTLLPNRTLTITHPDRTIHTTGPPTLLRAA